MIVDAFAILAICFNEPDAEQFAVALAETDERLISAVNYLEDANDLSFRKTALTHLLLSFLNFRRTNSRLH